MDDHAETNDLGELRRLRAAASVEPVVWEQPPPDLWDRIADAAFADDASTGTPDATATKPVTATQTATAEVPPPPIPLETARRNRTRWLLASAAAAIVVVVGVGMVMRSTSNDQVVAEVDLEQLTGAGEGTAQLVDDDGALELRLVADGVDNPDGFTEVWLINSDLTQLVSLGPIRDDETYVLPAGLDPAAFPIVDVSREPLDGNPEHSGDSVLRGQLTF